MNMPTNSNDIPEKTDAPPRTKTNLLIFKVLDHLNNFTKMIEHLNPHRHIFANSVQSTLEASRLSNLGSLRSITVGISFNSRIHFSIFSGTF